MKISQLFENEPIRLKGFKVSSDDTPASAFMVDFDQMTHEHPFTHGMRYFEDGPVLISMSASRDVDDQVEIKDIQSKARGAGARALARICDLADKHDVSIELYAHGYADVPTDKLVSYYERFGFECRNDMADGQDMVRRPHS